MIRQGGPRGRPCTPPPGRFCRRDRPPTAARPLHTSWMPPLQGKDQLRSSRRDRKHGPLQPFVRRVSGSVAWDRAMIGFLRPQHMDVEEGMGDGEENPFLDADAEDRAGSHTSAASVPASEALEETPQVALRVARLTRYCSCPMSFLMSWPPLRWSQ